MINKHWFTLKTPGVLSQSNSECLLQLLPLYPEIFVLNFFSKNQLSQENLGCLCTGNNKPEIVHDENFRLIIPQYTSDPNFLGITSFLQTNSNRKSQDKEARAAKDTRFVALVMFSIKYPPHVRQKANHRDAGHSLQYKQNAVKRCINYNQFYIGWSTD